MFTQEEQQQLLVIARESIRAALEGKSCAKQKPSTQALRKPGGVFVSVFVNGHLRGCVGYVDSPRSITQTVAELAPKAALEDYRFAPVELQELPDVRVEISILTAPRRITSVEEILVGTHGLILEVGQSRGLLLPRVPVDHNWSTRDFLEGVAQKAGLPRDAWSLPEAVMMVFEAEVLEEEESRA